MKFMKLGSKPDSFQNDGDNVWYVTSELATDVIINVGDSKFYLHKFPLLSKSGRLQKLIKSSNEGEGGEIDIHEIPGGPTAFEICAKFCYGMTATLNAYNVISTYCAADFLEMHESIDKGNLVYKLNVFLTTSIFRSWKDSIIVLQSTNYMASLAEEPKLVNLCINSIASKATVDLSKVDWSYTYNRKKLPEENVTELGIVRARMVPKDWWVEDLAELEIGLYKQVLVSIINKGLICNEVIGEGLKAFALRRLPGFNHGVVHDDDVLKARSVIEIISWLLPSEKGSVSCGFLVKLLKMAIVVDSGEMVKKILVKRIGQQLEEASVEDLLINTKEGESESTIYDVTIVQEIVKEFIIQDQDDEFKDEIQETGRTTGGILSEATKLMVVKLVDSYLTEISKDPNLPFQMFVDLAEMVNGFSRPSHDGLYRAIDMYLKTHPGISKSERKRICKLMDCKKLSVDACMHAVQNERLPLRVTVQVLFFEQARATASSGSSTPDLPKSIKSPNVSNGRPATNQDDDWDGVATAEELKALKEELAALRMSHHGHGPKSIDKAHVPRVKGLLSTKKIFPKIWSSKGGTRENSGSDSSESLGSANPDESKSTPSRKGRYSVS